MENLRWLPTLFLIWTDFGGHVNRFATLVDLKNNQFEVLMEKINVVVFLSKGWKVLRDFYGITLGARIISVFVRPGQFAINVKDQFGKTIKCPIFYVYETLIMLT